MIAFIIAPFFIALLVFILYRTTNHLREYFGKWTQFFLVCFSILLFGGVVAILIAFILPSSPLKRVFSRIGFYWLGIILYFFVGLFISIIIRSIVWIILKNKNYRIDVARNITIIFVVIFTSIMSIYGANNAHKLHVTDYEVTIDKHCSIDELNIVLLADLHIGYNTGLTEIKDMANKVNECNPDLIVIAGDIFDNEYDAIEEPEKMIEVLSNMHSKYGTYVAYGNHDIEEKILVGFTFDWLNKIEPQADERMNDFIKRCGFKLLHDEYILLEDSIYLYGRPDRNKINLGKANRIDATEITNNMDTSLPIIVIDHEPAELKQLASKGVDLDLSGHTHNGQLWPGTISIKWLWDNAYGLKQIENMTSIVTSGVGLFGPNMRTGCIAEICNIKVIFNK